MSSSKNIDEIVEDLINGKDPESTSHDTPTEVTTAQENETSTDTTNETDESVDDIFNTVRKKETSTGDEGNDQNAEATISEAGDKDGTDSSPAAPEDAGTGSDDSGDSTEGDPATPDDSSAVPSEGTATADDVIENLDTEVGKDPDSGDGEDSGDEGGEEGGEPTPEEGEPATEPGTDNGEPETDSGENTDGSEEQSVDATEGGEGNTDLSSSGEEPTDETGSPEGSESSQISEDSGEELEAGSEESDQEDSSQDNPEEEGSLNEQIAELKEDPEEVKAEQTEKETAEGMRVDIAMIKEAENISTRLGELARVIADRFPRTQINEKSLEAYAIDAMKLACESLEGQARALFGADYSVDANDPQETSIRLMLHNTSERLTQLKAKLNKLHSENTVLHLDVLLEALPENPNAALSDEFIANTLVMGKKVALERLTVAEALGPIIEANEKWLKEVVSGVLNRIDSNVEEVYENCDFAGTDILRDAQEVSDKLEGSGISQVSYLIPGNKMLALTQETQEEGCLVKLIKHPEAPALFEAPFEMLARNQSEAIKAKVQELLSLATRLQELASFVDESIVRAWLRWSEVKPIEKIVQLQLDTKLSKIAGPTLVLGNYLYFVTSALLRYIEQSKEEAEVLGMGNDQ